MHRSTTYVDAACYCRWSGVVCLSVSLSVCHDCEPCRTAEPIEMPFGMWTWVGPRKHILDRGAHWRHLANMIEPSMCSGMQPFSKLLWPLDYYFICTYCMALFGSTVYAVVNLPVCPFIGWTDELHLSHFCVVSKCLNMSSSTLSDCHKLLITLIMKLCL